MRVVYSLPEAQFDRDSVVTIGAFDGIHRGHLAVIDSLRRAAREHNRASVVVTFFPHPSVVLGRADPFYLTSTGEKIALLEPLGVDWLVVMNFTVEMSRTRAADYVSMLVARLRMREAHVGYDFAFGYKREGTIEFLRQAGMQRGFEVQVLDAQTNGGEPISSTGIRNALRAGDVDRAAKWLGRPFQLSGVVTHNEGDRAQLEVWQEHAMPADGAYACWARLGADKHRALVGLGTALTDKPARTVAARLLTPALLSRGANVSLDFVARLRNADEMTSANEVWAG